MAAFIRKMCVLEMLDDDEEDFLSEFAIRSKNITSVKNLILRRDYVPKVVNYMTEVIEQMGIPEHIDDFKAHYCMSRDTFYIVLENIQDTLIRNGKGPHEAVSPEKQLLVCLSYLASPTSMRETGHIFGLPKSTVHQIIHEVCDILAQLGTRVS